MKKLMMAVAIVCAAACAQAGFVTWNCSGVKENGTALTKGHTYAFFFETQDAATTARAAFTKNYDSLDALNSALDDAAWNDSKKATAAGNFGVGTTAVAGNYSKDDLDNSTFGLSGGTTYYGFLVITDEDGALDKDVNWTTTGVASKKTAGDSATTAASFAFSGAGGTWYSVETVPEPTSAMLLLLGMAGLALRRRRA